MTDVVVDCGFRLLVVVPFIGALFLGQVNIPDLTKFATCGGEAPSLIELCSCFSILFCAIGLVCCRGPR